MENRAWKRTCPEKSILKVETDYRKTMFMFGVLKYYLITGRIFYCISFGEALNHIKEATQGLEYLKEETKNKCKKHLRNNKENHQIVKNSLKMLKLSFQYLPIYFKSVLI